MQYKSHRQRNEKGELADRKVRKSERKSNFAYNRSLHSSSAKAERKRAAKAAAVAQTPPAA